MYFRALIRTLKKEKKIVARLKKFLGNTVPRELLKIENIFRVLERKLKSQHPTQSSLRELEMFLANE